jgi:hypothetical protein
MATLAAPDMKTHLPSWSSLVLVTPLFGGCAAQATVAPPAVSANVDVNGQAVAPAADANATATTDGAQTDSYEETDPAALTDFHQTLDAHGQWVEDPTYGTVWVPAAAEVGPTYTPYTTAGHWAYDDNNDYVWVSDYDWGWAPYHYGRWVEIDGRGWSWIPGRTYRGAWVTWGADDGYGTVGWAPMGPEYIWRGGVAVSYTYSGAPRWSYVGRGDVFAPNVGVRVMTGAAAAGVAGRVHVQAGVGGGRSGGPPPEKLGIAASAAPHVSASSNPGFAKAQNFGRPSVATTLGAHPATHGTLPSAGGGGRATAATGGLHGTTLPAGGAAPTAGYGGAIPKEGAGGPATEKTGGATHGTLPTTGTAHAQVDNAHAAPSTLPVQQHQPIPQNAQTPGRKKPTTDPTPVPQKGAPAGGHGGGGGGGGGGGSGGHGNNPPKQK